MIYNSFLLIIFVNILMPKIVPKNDETLLFCEKCNTNSTKSHFYHGTKLIKIFERCFLY